MPFFPTSKRFASTTHDETIRIWDLENRRAEDLHQHEDVVWDLAVSPNGAQLASASADGTVRLWDVKGMRTRRILRGHDGSVTGVAYSPDGTILISVGVDGTVRSWDARSGTVVDRIDANQGPLRATVVAQELDPEVKARFIADGFTADDLDELLTYPPRVLAVTAGSYGTIKLWDLTTLAPVGEFNAHTSPVYGLAFDHLSRTLASVGADGAVNLWDVASRASLTTLGSHDGWAFAAGFSVSGRTLVTGGADGTVRAWDLASHSSREVTGPPASWVREVAFSPDGRLLAYSSDDDAVHLFDANTLEHLFSLPGAGRCTSRDSSHREPPISTKGAGKIGD